MTDHWSRRDVLRVAAGTAAAALAVPRAVRAQDRPNVLFILADDLGYGDLSCYGRPDYETPVLDRLATQGMKFMSAYAAAPVCTPTRCAFLTGRYPQRFEVGLQEPLTASSPPVGLPASQPTIASRLRAVGYETALIGKWHLGWRPEYQPNRHGFDEFYGSLSGALDYFTHVAPDAGIGTEPDLWENDRRTTADGYLTDVFTDRAVDFVTRPHSKPFYLSLHYTAPHSPWEGPDDRATADHTDHGAGPMTNGGSLGAYAEMMRSMDSGIGRVLAALRRARLERNTLVIFTSDNGGERYSFNWPFSFQKLYLVRRRHPRAGHRALARSRACRRRDRASRDHDGLDRNDPRGGRCAGRRWGARRREPATDTHARARALRARAVLAHTHARGGAHRPMEIRARRRGRAPLRSRRRSR